MPSSTARRAASWPPSGPRWRRRARNACLLTPGATAVRGRTEIASILAQMIARGSQIEIEAGTVRMAGEVALVFERWSIRSPGAEGAVLEQRVRATLVLRQLEGAWKLAIAEPWGALPER